MFNHKKLARKPKQFQSLTGVSPAQFDSLYCATKKQYKTAEARRLFKKKKKRHRSRTLIPSHTQGQITDVTHVLQNVHKLQFIGDDLWTGQIKCMQGIKYLEPAVKQSIPIPQKKYADAKKATTLEELERQFLEFQIILDATEQPIPKPKDKKKRKMHYSGKKKRHTVKNQYPH